MDARAQSYAGIVIDASFFVRPFSEEFRQMLSDTPVYCAQTWENAVAVMGAGLEEIHKHIFEENLAVIMQKKPQFHDGASCITDVVGMIRSLASLGAARGQRYLFASADQMLIQRLVLEQVQIDIYNLWTDIRIPAESFQRLAGTFEFARVTWSPAPTAETNEEELILHDEKGSPVRLHKLHDMRMNGGEAVIYTCPAKPGLLAKIYRKNTNSLNAGKIKNIEKLQEKFTENPGFSWAKVPLEKLYLEPERRNVVGFLMKTAEEGTLLDELELLDEDRGDIEVQKVVKLCRTLIRQVACLSIYGFCVYDYNDRNFSYSVHQPDFVQMMDTDSFCGGDYFTDLRNRNINTRKDFVTGETTKAEALLICTEFAYIYTGYMMLRKSELLQKNGQIIEEDASVWRMVPHNMQELLCRVFGGEMEYFPQFDLLISELVKAEQMLVDLARDGKRITYGNLEDMNQEKLGSKRPEPERTGPAPETPEDDNENETDRPNDSGYEEDSGFDEFEVDEAVFQPTGRMLIRQAPPAAGPRKRENPKEYYFAPAPLRELYAKENENDRQDRDAARWQKAKQCLKISAVVFAVLFVCWCLFVADPVWLTKLRQTVSQGLQWMGELWENLTETLADLVEKIVQRLLTKSDR